MCRYPVSRDCSTYSLTGGQHASKLGILRRGDRQRVDGLDLDPHARVRAPIGGKRGCPLVGAGVGLGAVHIVGNGDKLRVDEVVGKGLAPGGGPEVGAGLPGVAEGDDVVDIELCTMSVLCEAWECGWCYV